ncbi:MAG: TAXI family TRAP transporter solute-binding subunit [Candidatus Tectomicrobia bacterium]|nr:TAXI family TRAP transporter solute-binding subunit [Candidatus Tectomicrobia bacterium]
MAQCLVLVLGMAIWTQQAHAQGIGIVTGSKTGTYIRFGRDIAKSAKKANLQLIVKESEGSLSNIRRMVSKENAGLGIVQSDVLGFLNRSNDPEMRRIAHRLRLVFPFYNEEVHLFARKDIQRLSDLNGKRVVVGTKGSGNWLTANNILRLGNIQPGESLELAPSSAVSAVLTGKADAMFYIAGKPVTVFTRMRGLQKNPKYAHLVEQVHFLPLDDENILREYVPSSIEPSDYSWVSGNTPTVAVKAVLVGFDFSSRRNAYYRTRCKQMATLGKAIRANFPTLLRSGHPKWKEVDLEQEIGIWQRDRCASPNAPTTMAAAPTAQPKSANQEELMKAIEIILTSDSQ